MMTEEQKQAWLWIFIAGTAGALVRAIISPTSWGRDVTSVMGGSLIAAFGAPGIISAIPGVGTQSASMAVAFVVGLVGMTLCKAIIQVAEDKIPTYLRKITEFQIKRITPTEPKPDQAGTEKEKEIPEGE